ncbi:MAG: HDIG domain-containing protein [Muribaculaceae bacterium]|nr:HDIG domain-containing protein [Muribaculaceae bacterium]
MISPFVKNLFDLYYSNDRELLATVLTHSECVAGKALDIARAKNLDVDLDFVRDAAMLHDIGVVRCDAPSILCRGELPYICHGVEGRKMLDKAGLPRHALVCERHTGSGLTVDDIRRQALPLPLRDLCPVSLEEKLICYADKFFSKSGNLTQEKDLGKVIRQMEAFGTDSLQRFMALHALFS